MIQFRNLTLVRGARELIADASEATAVASDKDAADKAMADLVALRASVAQ